MWPGLGFGEFDPGLVLPAGVVVAWDDADADADADADVLWLAEVLVVARAEGELDDPPHAASSSTSDPSPATAAHPLLRIMSLFLPCL